MFWKESLFISVLFYYYDFLSDVFLFQITGLIYVLFSSLFLLVLFV